MEVIVCICLIVLVTTIIAYLIYKNNVNCKTKGTTDVVKKESEVIAIEKETFFPSIQIIENHQLVPSYKNKIIDSKVKNAIAIIDNSATKLTQATKNVINVKKITEGGKVLFSASEKDVGNMLSAGKNQFYGTQVSSTTKKFAGQTKFNSETTLTKNMTKNQLASAGFNLVSLVVGQYYMSEINDKLDEINKNISNISDFLETRYTSDLKSIVSKIFEIVENQSEILENEYSRDKNFDGMSEQENLCVKLLGQANDEIKEKTKNIDLDFKNYLNNIKEIEKWYDRQQVLQQLLLKIGDLKYVLAYGNQSSKLCHTQYNIYLNETNNINKILKKWHTFYIDKFKIDIEKQRKKGNIFKFHIIGNIKEDWKYSKLQNNIAQNIASQIQPKELKFFNENKQDEKIIIQKYNGEYYNLPIDYQENI